MIIMPVEKLKDFLIKIWKSELLKVINNSGRKMLIVTHRFQGGIYPRHFLSNFFQLKK